MIERYEQIRKVALSEKLPKTYTRGMGIFIQKGMTDWIKAISEFQPEPIQKATPQTDHVPKALVEENNLNIDLTNILAEMTLKNIMEQIQI